MQQKEEEYSLYNLFIPFTTLKAAHYLIIIGLVVFGNMLFNNFVWDDKTFIILNPDVYSINIPYLFGQNLFNDTVYYRPIPATYFAILYSFFNINAFPYHLLQLVLHIANSILLFRFFQSFLKKTTSFVLSVIFLVHPMQVESVSYIAQTVSPLYFFFGLVGLMLIKRKITTKKIAGSQILLLAALLTKETGILFVLLTNIYTYLHNKSKVIIILGSSIATVAVYLFIRFSIAHVFFAKSLLIAPIANISLSERLLNAPAVVWYYIKTFFYPVTLGINQHWIITQPSFTNFYMPLILELILFGFIVWLGKVCYKKSKEVFHSFLFFAGWFVVGLVFHSQLVPLDMTVADRWFYSTMVGLLGLIGLAYEIVVQKKQIKRVILTVTILFICLISVRTMVRNMDWQEAVKLYTHDISIDDNFDIENSLGWEYIQSQQYDQAVYHIKKSIQFWPQWDKNWYNLGVAYHYSGQIASAKSAYETALKHNPDYVQVEENLGYLLAYYYSPNDAKRLLSHAIEKRPHRSKLWYFRAIANYKLNQSDEAKQDIIQAYTLNPYDQNIANIYYQLMNNIPLQFK